MAECGHHRLLFNGLVVKHLDTPVLAGMPFHRVNHIQINYSLSYIVLEDCCKIQFNPEKGRRKSVIKALRVARTTCVLPGQSVTFQLPNEFRTKEKVAVEPRTTVPKDMPNWLRCCIVSPDAEGCITVKNTCSEPVLLSKHAQVCQVRDTIDITSIKKLSDSKLPVIPQEFTNTEITPRTPEQKLTSLADVQMEATPKTPEQKPAIVIDVDPTSQLSKSEKATFHSIHKEYEAVFSPGIGCYNHYSGKFEHQVNMSKNLPPQRKGRVPDYCREDKEILQGKFDRLLAEGVLARAEDVENPVEYVHPSLMVKKSSGGHRFVTSFGEMGEYARPQPTINSNVEHAMHQIGQYNEMIIADFSESYYQVPVDKESSSTSVSLVHTLEPMCTDDR